MSAVQIWTFGTTIAKVVTVYFYTFWKPKFKSFLFKVKYIYAWPEGTDQRSAISSLFVRHFAVSVGDQAKKISTGNLLLCSSFFKSKPRCGMLHVDRT